MSKRICILGYGLLGRALAKSEWVKSYEVTLVSRTKQAGVQVLNIADEQAVQRFFDQQAKFDIVINCAAYTDVDACERDPLEAHAVNALGVRNVLKALEANQVPFVQISTNYVFSGQKGKDYLASDETDPCSIYGLTKLAGEAYAMQHRYVLIVRPSWIFGKDKRDFISIMLEKFVGSQKVMVACDQVSSATYAFDLALAIGKLVESELLPAKDQSQPLKKISHAVNQGHCTRFDMVKWMAKVLKKKNKVLPIPREQLGGWIAKRPSFSALKSDVPMRSWKDALKERVIS